MFLKPGNWICFSMIRPIHNINQQAEDKALEIAERVQKRHLIKQPKKYKVEFRLKSRR